MSPLVSVNYKPKTPHEAPPIQIIAVLEEHYYRNKSWVGVNKANDTFHIYNNNDGFYILTGDGRDISMGMPKLEGLTYEKLMDITVGIFIFPPAPVSYEEFFSLRDTMVALGAN